MYQISYTKAIDLERRSRQVAEGIFETDRLTWSAVLDTDVQDMEPGSQILYQVMYPSNYDSLVMVERLR